MRELTGVQVPGGWKVRRPKRLGVPGGATLPVSTLKDCLFPVLSVAVAFGNASTIAGGAGADAPARFLDTSHGFQRSPPPCHEIPGRTKITTCFRTRRSSFWAVTNIRINVFML